MNVRIIAGKYGGRFLKSPNSKGTHPMGERIRGAIFNKISGELAGARVLDAFAGTGALGLEALSRAAESVVFVEKDRKVARVLEENVRLLGAESGSKVIVAGLGAWLGSRDSGDTPSGDCHPNSSRGITGFSEVGDGGGDEGRFERETYERFQIVFADPPYHDPQWGLVQKLVEIVVDGGMMIVSRVNGKGVMLDGMELEDSRQYADAVIEFWRKKR